MLLYADSFTENNQITLIDINLKKLRIFVLLFLHEHCKKGISGIQNYNLYYKTSTYFFEFQVLMIPLIC